MAAFKLFSGKIITTEGHEDFFTIAMPVSKKSLENLKKGKKFAPDYQPSMTGRSEAEFEIRRALLENKGEKLKEVVNALIEDSVGQIVTKYDKDGNELECYVKRNTEAAKVLFDRGFGKVTEKLEVSGDLASQIGELLATRMGGSKPEGK